MQYFCQEIAFLYLVALHICNSEGHHKDSDDDQISEVRR